VHPDVFNTLLQVFDDGRLTDGQGRTIDFKNTVILMTSNVGSQFIRDVEDVEQPEVKAQIELALRAAFKPEFLNRVDDIIIFHSLDQAQLTAIIDIQLQRLEQRLAAQQLTLEVDKLARKFLGREGHDPQFGARPLKRTIQERLLDPLALKLLEGEFKPGDSIKVTCEDDQLVFRKR
jgi:ATP-dependent Clp protease ATP-binding subunit ClpB